MVVRYYVLACSDAISLSFKSIGGGGGDVRRMNKRNQNRGGVFGPLHLKRDL